MRRSRWFIFCLLIFVLIACGGENNYYNEDEYADNYYNEEATINADSNTQNVAIQTNDDEWLKNFASYLQDTFEQDNIPGMAVSIVQGDQIIFANGYGLRDIKNNLPVTPETLFHIGSTHKSMNSMLIATLVEEGLFDWDSPVTQIYPAFALSNPDYTTQVTIRHLLSMRAGIPDYAEDDLAETASAEQVFPLLAETDLLGAPGEEFSYSNLSATAAGYLAVIASGGNANDLYNEYARLLQARILNPIGMTDATIYASQAAASANVSFSYAVYNDGEAELTASYDRDGDALAPSGSLKANVLDMALYISTQLNGGIAPNGNRIVSQSILSETWQPYLEDYGMGWESQTYQGVEVIMHTGAYDGFVSVLGFIPDYEVGFVILINSEDVGDNLLEDAPQTLVELLSD